MINNIWAVVLSIIILFVILLILWFLFKKKVGGSSNQGKVQEVKESKEDSKEQHVEKAKYRELNEEEKNTSEKDYKYDKDKVRNKLKELE